MKYAVGFVGVHQLANALRGQVIEFDYYPSINDGPANIVRVSNGPVPADMLWVCSEDDAEGRFYFFNETKDAVSEWFEDGDAEAAIKAAHKIMWYR